MVKNLSIIVLFFSTLCMHAADNQNAVQMFKKAVLKGKANLVDTLLRTEPVSVDTPIKFFDKDVPALLVAAEEVDVPMMNTLMNHGANIKAVDSDGNTVLHYLANSRHQNIDIEDGTVASLIRFFVKNGVDTSAKNNDQETALFLAAAQKSSSSCVDELMTDNIEDRHDALLEAISYYQPKNISKLLLYGTPIHQDHKECAEEKLNSTDIKLLKKDKKTRHLIKHGTQSEYFVKRCFGEFRERLKDKRSPFQILKARQIGKRKN